MKIEKLELRHLAGYLPYGLKALCVRTNEIRTVTLLHFTYDLKTVGHNHLIYEGLLLEKHKPILRPLSDLTKEIEVNWEKFVPMELLLDIETKHNWSNSDYLECQSGQNEWWVKLKDKNPSYIFGYNSIMGFYLLNQFSEKQFVRNQLELFEKLYEWHFDIHGLIENNLAIDINTLEK